MMTGRPPFQAATPAETLRLVLDNEPVARKQLNPAIQNDLNTICLKCLHKEPHRRYARRRRAASRPGPIHQPRTDPGSTLWGRWRGLGNGPVDTPWLPGFRPLSAWPSLPLFRGWNLVSV